MNRMLRYTFAFLLLAGIFMAEGCRTRGAEPRAHKRMWRKWSKKSDAFNPYVKHDKSTHEMSRKQKREDARTQRQAKREYKKWQRKSKRKVGG